MKITMKKTLLTMLTVLILSVLFCFSAGALWYGDFNYDNGYKGIIIRGIANTTGETVTIPEQINGKDVVEINDYYINDSVKHINIPDTVTEFNLSGLKSLRSVHLQGNFAYNVNRSYNFGSATEISVDSDNENLTIVDGVLFSKDMKNLCYYPKYKIDKHYDIPEGVQFIPSIENEYIESIYFPNTVTDVGYRLMQSCPKLTKIFVDSLESWYEIGLFFDDYESFCHQYYDLYIDGEKVENLVIPEGVTEIPAKSFYKCQSIEQITVPDSLRKIGADAFFDTGWFKKMPDDEIIYLGEFALGYKNVYSIDDKSVSIKSNVKYISDSAFVSLKATEVILPYGLKEIGKNAFGNCDNIKEIIIPETVEYIGKYALGYYAYHFAGTNNIYKKYDDFVIIGVKGSVAEKYAEENDFKFVECEPHAHNYTSEIIKEANCKEQGEKCLSCICGEQYTESIPTLGHNEVTLKAVTPTYTKTGLTEGKKCSVCGKTTVKQKKVAKKKLKKVTVSSVKSTKAKQALVKWKKVTDASGYVIEYSTSKKFTKKTTKTVKIKKGKTVKATLKKLKSGKKYYVRIKAYRTEGKKTVYSSYSKVKTVKIK